MRNAAKAILTFTAAAALIGCGNDAGDDGDSSNRVEINGSAVEVDTLPPDESVATPSEDLADGTIEAPEGNASY